MKKNQFTVTGVQPQRNRKYFQFNNARDCTTREYTKLHDVIWENRPMEGQKEQALISVYCSFHIGLSKVFWR